MSVEISRASRGNRSSYTAVRTPDKAAPSYRPIATPPRPTTWRTDPCSIRGFAENTQPNALRRQRQFHRAHNAKCFSTWLSAGLTLSSDQTMERKLKEASLSIRIERAFTKEQILELYLNQIYLGGGAYGVAAAAQTYWDKSLNELSIADCAYLATLPKAPSNYNPFRFPERAVARRNWVIDRMVENGFVTKEEGET